ncbi:MAG: glycosyltransferase [Jatrophihabitantaceae bacterium]
MNGADRRAPEAGRLTAVVTVGTDHHRFDRLMDWLESWQAAHPDAFDWIVQHGASRPMRAASGFTMKPRSEVLELLRGAAVVVTQGGPGGIMDARECGKLPIVVPRLARLAEVVDDHQIPFAEHLAGRGLVVTAQSEQELHEALDRACGDPQAFVAVGGAGDVAAAVARLEAAVEQLLASRPSRTGRRRRDLSSLG